MLTNSGALLSPYSNTLAQLYFTLRNDGEATLNSFALAAPAIPTPTLPTQINATTRKQHVVLNRLIVDRLLLALPPKTSDPSLVGVGLATFAGIFFTFEGAWQELNDAFKVDDKGLGGTHDAQIRLWLSTLRPEGLQRCLRLRDDLEYISNRTATNICPKITAQRQMLERMRAEIRAKPHVLLAYGWVMYMAIFSGGRWIRQQLANAGVEFWTGEPDCMESQKDNVSLMELSGFSFLSFDGEHDGEDLKGLFKARLAEAETLLTQQERQEVIQAAQRLFEDCIALIRMLDRAVWWRKVWSQLRVSVIFIVALIILFLLLR